MIYQVQENRSLPKPKPKRKEIHVTMRHIKRPEELEVAAKALFLGNSVHVDITQYSLFRRIASFKLIVDHIAIGWGFKRQPNFQIKRLEEQIEVIKKIEMPNLHQQEEKNEEDEDDTVPCGIILQGGEIDGTEIEITDENDNESIVPDIAEIILTFDSDYLDAIIGKDERGEPYLYIKDTISGLEFYVQKIPMSKRGRKRINKENNSTTE